MVSLSKSKLTNQHKFQQRVVTTVKGKRKYKCQVGDEAKMS